MKSIYIASLKDRNKSVDILTLHLEELGHRVTRQAVYPCDVTVRWGVSYKGEKPSLNAKVNHWDKVGALFQFIRNGINAPYPHVDFEDYVNMDKGQIILARNSHHSKGKDIVVCETLERARDLAKVKDFFVKWIPTETEYRMWGFRGRLLGVYEKVFKGPREYQGYMRNHRFGFRFERRDDLRHNEEYKKLVTNALKALDLDFGAVDIILGRDAKLYVLEVNTAPAITGLGMSSGIRLAKQISNWAEAQ
jgi:RimK-like ATP-grasp domain